MRFEIKEAKAVEKAGTSKVGRPYRFMEQMGFMDTGRAYPQEVKFILRDGQVPLAVGSYELGSKCFWVDRFGGVQLDLSHADLVGKPAAAAVAAVRG